MKTTYTLTHPKSGEKQSLTNDGKLEIVPIGVGSMLSTLHFNTNYLVIKGEEHFLIDCGRTAPEALRSLGINILDIQNILPTHAHDDHIGGIGTLAIANRYVGRALQNKPKLTIVAPRCFAGPLWEESLKGNLSSNEEGQEKKGMKFSDWFDLVEPMVVPDMFSEYRETYILEFAGFELQIFRTMHVPSTATSWRDSAWSTGILIDKKVFISGDTRFDPEMIATYSAQSDLIFHDAALFNDPVHASVMQLETLPVEVKSKMHLIHYGDGWRTYQMDRQMNGFAGWAVQGGRYVIE